MVLGENGGGKETTLGRMEEKREQPIKGESVPH